MIEIASKLMQPVCGASRVMFSTSNFHLLRSLIFFPTISAFCLLRVPPDKVSYRTSTTKTSPSARTMNSGSFGLKQWIFVRYLFIKFAARRWSSGRNSKALFRALILKSMHVKCMPSASTSRIAASYPSDSSFGDQANGSHVSVNHHLRCCF